MGTRIQRKSGKHILQQNSNGKVEYLTFPKLGQTEMIEHVITTRIGGVSRGIYATMNLSYSRGDRRQDVDENYKRVADILHTDIENIVCTDQTHTTNVRVVTKEDAGKGVTRNKDYRDVDALVTNEPGIALAIFYADCVPLLFVDTVHKAIGAAHSGWRGTVGKIAKNVITTMEQQYGTNPKDVVAGIGPSICQECYEVSEDVACAFQNAFYDDMQLFKHMYDTDRAQFISLQNNTLFEQMYNNLDDVLLYLKPNGKYQLNLWMANLLVMMEAGIPLKNISVTDICTCCNPDYLFSHRANQEKRGNLGAFIKLKK